MVDLLTGREMGPNERGLILISGPTVTSPYWNNQKATMEDFKYSGWRNTGALEICFLFLFFLIYLYVSFFITIDINYAN